MEGPRADHLGTGSCQSSQDGILGDFKIRDSELATSSEIACVGFLAGVSLGGTDELCNIITAIRCQCDAFEGEPIWAPSINTSQ